MVVNVLSCHAKLSTVKCETCNRILLDFGVIAIYRYDLALFWSV